jgi:3-dehydroquinate dehydratase type I
MATDRRDALGKMARASRRADMIELRMDGLAQEDLEPLMAARTLPVLVTNRKKAEGGLFAGTERQRIKCLKRAVALGCELVDIELSTGEKTIQTLADMASDWGGRTKLLISYHHFEETPPEVVLKKKVEAAERLGAGFVKIATLARRPEDNLRVLGLIPFAGKMGLKIVAFCMGDLGRFSRIASPLLGASFTFSSLSKGAESAPGQMTAAEMRRVCEILSAKG